MPVRRLTLLLAAFALLVVPAGASAASHPRVTKVWAQARIHPGTGNVVDSFKLWVAVRGPVRVWVWMCAYGLHDTVIAAGDTNHPYLMFPLQGEECWSAYRGKAHNRFFTTWYPDNAYQGYYRPLLLGAKVGYRIMITVNPQPNAKPQGSVTISR